MEQSYKEKYEDVLARLAKAKNDNDVCDERFCCAIDEIIPELVESEDEKVREELIDAVQGLWDNDALPMPLSVKRKDKWIAWLEKQGSEKDNLSIDFVLGHLGIKPAYKDGNAWCILLGDNIQEGICGFGDTKEEALIAFMKELIEKQGKQKPAEENKGNIGGISPNSEWSEEEIEKAAQEWDSKANFNPFYMTMDGDKPTGVKQSITTHKESFKAGVIWILKSIKGRVQPKQEWNEEDSIRLQRIIDFLWYNRKGDTDTIYQQEQDIDWLKSLRPQNRWKPSSEQMDNK